MLLLREAIIEDVPVILDMLLASARDQGFPDEVAVSAADLAADGFGPNPRFQVMLSEVNGIPAGMALFFVNYSTWGSRFVLYLEDLYVHPDWRGRGVAAALLRGLARRAIEKGCGRLQWTVHRENRRAVRFYEKLGARALDDWMLMNAKGRGLERLAKG